MAADDLSAPLGQGAPAKPGRRRKRAGMPVKLTVTPSTAILAVLGFMLAVFFGWAMIANDPMGGEPSVVVAVTPGVSSGSRGPAVPGKSADAGSPPAASGQPPGIVTIIDGSTGKRQEVPIGGGAVSTVPDERLLEASRHGPIPRIAPDGTRPADAYARPLPAAASANPNTPRIAIVLTGLGVGSKLTAQATDKLPGPVTLAFTPYAADAASTVLKAREAGHEVLLQVPMEPFDYPDSDPGPQTLLTSLTVEQNTDRLYWIMSRFPGFVGLTNFMGARFTATEAALAPILKEAARRGLIYFDDGASTRSLAGQIAGANSMPFAKADVVLDAVPTQAEIAKAFTRLETAARANGTAIGVASALPITVERIAQWAKTAESRGFVLVPISAAALRNKSS